MGNYMAGHPSGCRRCHQHPFLTWYRTVLNNGITLLANRGPTMNNPKIVRNLVIMPHWQCDSMPLSLVGTYNSFHCWINCHHCWINCHHCYINCHHCCITCYHKGVRVHNCSYYNPYVQPLPPNMLCSYHGAPYMLVCVRMCATGTHIPPQPPRQARNMSHRRYCCRQLRPCRHWLPFCPNGMKCDLGYLRQ